jgi:superfamily I DNA and RNA helicase
LPPVEEIFGKNLDGTARVVIHPAETGKPKQDIILDVCYRNSRPVLSTAHALGFGIYREKGLVQIFENKNLWFDIGYREENAENDEIEDGESVILSRTEKSSPEFLEQHSPVDDLIKFEVFESAEQQTEWLVNEIRKNLNEQELIPDDIVVINPNPLTTKEAVGDARRILLKNGINSNLAGVTTIADVFTEPGTVTFTGVFRATGTEAAMVYVINAQDCFSGFLPRDVALVRNRLFTAITRSKAWVRVLGVGKPMASLKDEFEKAKTEKFKLHFRYPTEEERKTMMTVNRDMSKADQERSAKRRNNFAEIIASLESGESFIEDYPEALVKKLHTLLAKKSTRGRK